MGWDSGGFMGSAGESSQGMDADAVGSGIGGDAVGNFFDSNYVDKYGLRALAQQRVDLGLPAFSQTSTFHSPEVQAYLDRLQKNIDYYGRLNQGALLPGPVSNTPHNSALPTSIANNQNYSYYGHGGPLEHNLHSLGIGPNYNGIGMDFGGHPGSVGPMGPAEGGGEPYVRPRRLAYENAYDQWDEQGGFGGGM